MRARVAIGVGAVACALAAAFVVSGARDKHVAPTSAPRRDPVSTSVPRVAPSSTRPVPSAASRIRVVPIRSSYETSSRVVERDIGISVPLPDGHDLWLFGDTRVDQRNGAGGWDLTNFIDGSTALDAEGPRGQVPLGVEYPAGTPVRFIPVPTDVYFTDGSGRPCVKGVSDAAFSARWPTGAALMPGDTSEVLVTYSEVCAVYPAGGSPQDTTEGWGYLLYNWRTQRIDQGPVDVFVPTRNGAELAPASRFGSPVFDRGRVTLFSLACPPRYLGCVAGQVWSVTMPATAAALSNPASYRLHLLSTDAPGSWQPLAISVGRYPAGLRLVAWNSIAGNYKIFSAESLDSQWHLDHAGVLPGCGGHALFCFALYGHPELSTTTDLFVSYVDPDSGPTGHVVISALPDPPPTTP
jgi:hypothetical protein